MKNVFIVTSVLAVAFASSFAHAEEEDRSGFFLAGGLGLSTNSFEASYDGQSASDSGYGGVMTSIKIGGYINPNFALYYQREASFFDDDAGYGAVAGLMGIGGTYYFEPSGGMYLEAGLGLGDFTSDDAGLEGVGGAVMLGLGGEITKNLDGGVVLMRTATEETSLDGLEYGTFTLGAKLTLKL